jgi:hypothetical protein
MQKGDIVRHRDMCVVKVSDTPRDYPPGCDRGEDFVNPGIPAVKAALAAAGLDVPERLVMDGLWTVQDGHSWRPISEKLEITSPGTYAAFVQDDVILAPSRFD